LLDAIAARTPAPGGGTAAAWAAALAASLVEMAANFSEGAGADASFERAGRLRTRALELAEVELHAYEPVLEALRLPRENPERAARVDAARTEASRSPLEITRVGAELTELAGGLAQTGNPNLSGDALAAALLAEAAAQAAARLVAINLTEGPAVAESSQLAQRALAARERALG
jgi:methenyltetrahydrofolate cyclohydrolase